MGLFRKTADDWYYKAGKAEDDKDYEKYYRYLENAAQMGHTEAQFKLGDHCYKEGDLEKGRYWILESIKNGNTTGLIRYFDIHYRPEHCTAATPEELQQTLQWTKERLYPDIRISDSACPWTRMSQYYLDERMLGIDRMTALKYRLKAIDVSRISLDRKRKEGYTHHDTVIQELCHDYLNGNMDKIFEGETRHECEHYLVDFWERLLWDYPLYTFSSNPEQQREMDRRMGQLRLHADPEKLKESEELLADAEEELDNFLKEHDSDIDTLDPWNILLNQPGLVYLICERYYSGTGCEANREKALDLWETFEDYMIFSELPLPRRVQQLRDDLTRDDPALHDDLTVAKYRAKAYLKERFRQDPEEIDAAPMAAINIWFPYLNAVRWYEGKALDEKGHTCAADPVRAKSWLTHWQECSAYQPEMANLSEVRRFFAKLQKTLRESGSR